MVDLDQGIIIENINKKFKAENLSSELRLNKDGVCHGLAMVYAKYCLDGKEKEFRKMVELIASGKPNRGEISELEQGNINLFATQVLIAFSPEIFQQEIHQSTSMEVLKSKNGKSLKSAFDFALATNDENWIQIIKSIALKENEVMNLISVNHSIAIRRNKEGHYEVYDPNYSELIKTFKSEKELIRELHDEVFNYKKGNLGMKVHIIRDPEDQSPRIFPSVSDLYKKYLGTSNPTAITGTDTFDTLDMIVRVEQNKEIVTEVLNQIKHIEPKKILLLAKIAIVHNNSGALETILKEIEKDSVNIQKNFQTLFQTALSRGMHKMFDTLGDTNFDKYYKGYDILPLIEWAAKGGNPTLLTKIIEKNKDHENERRDNSIKQGFESYKKQLQKGDVKTEQEIENILKQTDVIQQIETTVDLQLLLNKDENYFAELDKAVKEAINGKSAECVNIMINHLVSEKKRPLSETEKMAYLVEAIRRNKPDVIYQMIHLNPKISAELLNSISITPLTAKGIDLSVFNELKNGGMFFSNSVQEVINEKRTNKLVSLGTLLEIAINYLHNLFTETPIAFEENLFKNKKNECQKLLSNFENIAKTKNKEDHARLIEEIKDFKTDLAEATDLDDLDQILKELNNVINEEIRVNQKSGTNSHIDPDSTQSFKDKYKKQVEEHNKNSDPNESIKNEEEEHNSTLKH